MKRLTCACEREVPVIAVWTALSKALSLKCSTCSTVITRESLFDDVDQASVHAQAVLAAHHHLVTYGQTSYGALLNTIGVDHDHRVVSGLLGGLQRAGLIQRADEGAMPVEQLGVGYHFPVYVPGPLFPGDNDA